MTYFQRLTVNTLIFISLLVVFPGMTHVRGIMPVITAVFVFSILNMLVEPVLTVLSSPFTLLTSGLFNFVVNAVILQTTSSLVGGMSFSFSSFWAAVLMAVIVLTVNTIVTDYNLSKYE